MSSKGRLLIFIVAFNAERTIDKVLGRIPASLVNDFAVEVLAIDDASSDRTFEVGDEIRHSGKFPFPLRVLVNPVNQGYGGNQKLGYQYAIENGFDVVALVHGDGQYAPEALPNLLLPLLEGAADAVFGSRMLIQGAARHGGMPFYKFAGNKILTWIENRLLGTALSEFHSGYRIYSVAALKRVPFHRNTNDFHFDTEIIIQLVIASQRIVELPIPTYYGDEICRVNGLRYAKNVVFAALKARAQAWSILYDPKFDCACERAGNEHYTLKLGYESTHQAVFDLLPRSAKVLDLGCAGGSLGAFLREQKQCYVSGVDAIPLLPTVELDSFTQHDLNDGCPGFTADGFDYVLLLDVIEHLSDPEQFILQLRCAMSLKPKSKLIISTGNVAFLPIRLMLLLGQFNYGKRGILDLTHRRLFTFTSLRRVLEQGGFELLETRGISAPFPLAVGGGWLGRALVAVNSALAKVLPSVFSYQILCVARPTPLVGQLLDAATIASKERQFSYNRDHGAQPVPSLRPSLGSSELEQETSRQ